MGKVEPDCRFYDNELKGYVWAWSEWAKDEAIASAVAAERRRVLDVLNKMLHGGEWHNSEYRYLKHHIDKLFPDGEPTAEESSVDQTNPPAWNGGIVNDGVD